jgi:hypothetical protein
MTKLRFDYPDGSKTNNTILYQCQSATLASDDFEQGWGHYTPRGAYSYLYSGTDYSHNGNQAAQISYKDISGNNSSFSLTNPIDIDTPGYNSLRIEFWFNSNNFYEGQNWFLDYYNGTKWQTRREYRAILGSFAPEKNTDSLYKCADQLFFHDTVWINESMYRFPTNMNIRFRSDTDYSYSYVYIDQIYINASTIDPPLYTSTQSYTLLGVYNYSIWCRDINGNTNSSVKTQFTVLEDITPPQITNILVTPSIAIQGVPVNVTCNVQDNAKLQDIRIFITDPNDNTVDYSIITNKINPDKYYYIQLYYTIGTYDFYIWAKDVNNNIITSETYSFEITNCPPLLSNEAPSNRSNNIVLNPPLSVTINHHTNDNVEWWISISTSEAGPWEQIAHDNLVNGNGVMTTATTTFQDYYTRYYWKVEATDGTDTTIKIYSFVTESINTAVNLITPYIVTTPMVDLTTSGSPTLNDVTLLYRYSNDNVTWSAQTPGNIGNAVVPTYDYEWDNNYGHIMDAIRLGTSEYYLIAYQGESSDGYLCTIHVWNNSGLIQQSVVDVWEHDTTDGGYDSIVHVAGDVYAITYRDASPTARQIVFTVNVDDANGDITNAAIDTQMLTYQGYECNIVHANDNIYAVAYREASTNDGFIETISIDSSGNIGDSVIDSIEFNGTDGYYPKMTMIDSDTVAIVYQGTGTDGYLVTYDISSTGDITNTWADQWEFDTANGGTPNIIHINGNVYAIAFEDSSGDGQIKTVTIANTGMITKSWIDTLEFDTADAGYQYLFHVAYNVYGVSYQGTSADGYICTMTIDNNGTISNTIIDSLEFDTSDNVWYATVIPISGNYFLIVYETTGNDGMSHIVEINTDQVPGDISSILTFYEWDTNTGALVDAIRLGTSEYYLIAYQGESSDGYLCTIHVWNNSGLIQQSVVDVWEHDTTDGGYDSIVHVAGDVYAITYRDASPTARQIVFTVNVDDANGDITNAAIDTQMLTYQGYECNIVHANDNIYAVAYREASTNDGFIETISIDSSGNIGDSVIDSIEFNGTDGYYPKMTMIDSDTVAIVYQGTGTDGYLVTYDISSTGDITNTWADQWEFDTANGGTPNIIHINGNVYAIAFEDSSGDGQIKTVTIANTGMITKSWIDTLEFDTADAGYQYLFHVAYNVYGVSYQGTSADGYICTMTIDNNGTISNTIIDSLEFDTSDNVWYATVIPISGNYFLIVYEGTDYDGICHTVEINTDAGWKVWTNESDPDTTSPWSWDFNFPNGFGYYQFFSIGSKTGIPIETEPHKADAKCYYYNIPPTVSDIPDQTITGGSSFTTIDLDNYVTDENPDSSITWTYSGNTALTINITAHIATITYTAGWTGSETITFTAADTGGLSDSDDATFTVNT